MSDLYKQDNLDHHISFLYCQMSRGALNKLSFNRESDPCVIQSLNKRDDENYIEEQNQFRDVSLLERNYLAITIKNNTLQSNLQRRKQKYRMKSLRRISQGQFEVASRVPLINPNSGTLVDWMVGTIERSKR